MMIEIVLVIVLIVLLSFAVYHVAHFSTKEVPFEEVLAEQRQKRSLDILPTKNNKVQKKPKVKKLKPKRDDRVHKGSRMEIAPVHKPLQTKGKELHHKMTETKEPKREAQVKSPKEHNKAQEKPMVENLSKPQRSPYKAELSAVSIIVRGKKEKEDNSSFIEKKDKKRGEKQTPEEKDIKGTRSVEEKGTEKEVKAEKKDGNKEKKKSSKDNDKHDKKEEIKGKKIVKEEKDQLKKEESKVGKIEMQLNANSPKKAQDGSKDDKKRAKVLPSSEGEKKNPTSDRKGDKKKISPTSEKKPASAVEKKAFATSEKMDSRTDEKKGSTDEKSSPSDEKNGSSTVKKKSSSTGDKKGSSTGDKKGFSTGDKISSTGDKKGSSTGDKKGSSTGDKKGSSTGDKKGSSTGDKKGSSTGEKKVFSNSEIDSSTCEKKGSPTGEKGSPTDEKKSLSSQKEVLSKLTHSPKITSKVASAQTASPKAITSSTKVAKSSSGAEAMSQTKKDEKTKGGTAKVNSVMAEQMLTIEAQMQSYEKKKRKEERQKRISLSDDALSRLLPIIQKSQLSSNEIQQLIETLLNKQQLCGAAGGEWVAKGRVDPAVQLRRQLEELETRLREKEEAQETLSAKIADLRSDLNTERGRSSSLKKQLDNSSVVMQQKLDLAATLHKEQLASQLNELKVALNKEYCAKMVQIQQVKQQKNEAKLQQLQNSLSEVEKQLLQATTSQQESEAQCQQLTASLSETQQQFQAVAQEREELMKSQQQYQQHVAALKDESDQQSTAVNARLFEIQQQLSASEAALFQSSAQLTQVVKEKEQLHQQIISFEEAREVLSQNQVKLKKVLLEKSELENRLSQVETELDHHRVIIKNQEAEMELLKEEKESLASQSVRPAAEGQENGDFHFETKQTNDQCCIFYEEQVEALTKELSKVKEESINWRRHCNEEQENWNQIQTSTRALLRRIFPDLQPGAENMEHTSFLEEVEAASVTLKAQPPVVQVKTEVVEKIVEKVVQDPEMCKELEDVKKENSGLHEELKKLEAQQTVLEARVKSSAAAQEDTSSKIGQLEAENKSLAVKVDNYQSILANTEALLKNLQKSVQNEEQSWREKLLLKEEAVRKLTQENRVLSAQVTELQTSLDKVKQAEEMESQLNCLTEKLHRVEEAKGKIQEQLEMAQEQLNAANLAQVRANGPTNGVSCHEDDISQVDTASLVSSEGHDTHSLGSDRNKKKKKKSFFSILIRKSTNTETGGTVGTE